MTREEAIKSLKTRLEEGYSDFDFGKALDMAIEALSAERVGVWEHKPSKSGEWVWWQCSECGAVIYSESEADRKIHHAYCGVCGAKMGE